MDLMLNSTVDISQNPILLFATLLSALIALVSIKAIPYEIRRRNVAATFWMHGASLPILGLIYAWTFSKILVCDYQSKFLTHATAFTLTAVTAFVVFLIIKRVLKMSPGIDILFLVTFYIFRIAVVAAIVFAACYLQIASTSEAAYKLFGIQLKILVGGETITAPPVYRLLSEQRLTVKGRVNECRNADVTWTHEPSIGTLTDRGNGLGLYIAPEVVKNTEPLTLVARPKFHNDKGTIVVELVETPTEVKRYTWLDPDFDDELFDFVVISNTESWGLGDTEKLGEKVGKANEKIEACSVIKRFHAKNLLENYQAIIAIGTASREGTTDAEERQRAADRAKLLAKCLSDVLLGSPHENKPKIYTLNLGRFNATTPVGRSGTARERRAILIGVMTGKRNQSDVLKQFSLGRMRDKGAEPFIKFLADNYSSGSLEIWEGQNK
jgi:hypothetical protein